MSKTEKQTFNEIDNGDGIIFIEELEKASSEIKKQIAEQFEKTYNVKFGKEYGLSEEEFNKFLGGDEKIEENKFYNRDERWYLASQEETKKSLRTPKLQITSGLNKNLPENYYKESGVGSLYNTVQEMAFDENLKKYPVSVILDSNINGLINSINQKSQEHGGGSGISSIGKYGKIKIGTYSQNGTIGIVEIEYFESEKKLLLNGNLVFNFGGDGLDINTLDEAIDNIGKEIEYKFTPETKEESERRRRRLNMIRIQQIIAKKNN